MSYASDRAAPDGRRRFLLAGWVFGALVISGRAIEVQVVHAGQWKEIAADQHSTTSEVAAPRGSILDRNGQSLAVTREVVRVSIAPRELEDVRGTQKLLVEALGLSARQAARYTDEARSWHVIPGTYEPKVLEVLGGVRGVHIERNHQRYYPHGDLARGVLGAVIDGVGQGGIEEQYQSILAGSPGEQIAARDSRGQVIPGETVILDEPVAGGDVRITLDLELQSIAQEALAEAVRTNNAKGGDLIITDPHTGEILALVSARGDRLDALAAINSPYEPGSTIKPFTVATILDHGAGELTDLVDTQGGKCVMGGRPLTDTHPYGVITVAEALKVSSNCGIAIAAAALEPSEQYEALRDFGFGVQTGLTLPGEAPGSLIRPEQWSDPTASRLAIGYGVNVTPLQMAMAYGALANGGVLMEPRLLTETRERDGSVEPGPKPRKVRRVIPPSVAREVGTVMVDIVEDGTGTAARMESFALAGKTGTSRAYTPGVGYGGGDYFASFAGYFPADDPQLVIVMKLDSPKGTSYYGGATAAPAIRATLEAALAARTPLDRGSLLRSVRAPTPSAAATETTAATSAPSSVRFASSGAVVGSNIGVASSASATSAEWERTTDVGQPATSFAADGTIAIPDVTGMAPRVAVRRLQAAGLRVSWNGGSTIEGTRPASGSRAIPGDTITLLTRAVRP